MTLNFLDNHGLVNINENIKFNPDLITSSPNITEAQKYVIDARELNPNTDGSLANKIENLRTDTNDTIATFNYLKNLYKYKDISFNNAKAGWYVICYFETSSGAQANGNMATGAGIVLERQFNYYSNESYTIEFNKVTGKSTFALVNSCVGGKIIDGIREIIYIDPNNKVHRSELQVHYNHISENVVRVHLMHSQYRFLDTNYPSWSPDTFLDSAYKIQATFNF